jgi:predicted transcriptional regulator
MGLFDSWRRRRRRESVKLAEPEKKETTESEIEGEEGPRDNGDIVSLTADYERLVARREELQVERGELTKRLDRGEIDADQFRKELMARIQEAAQVSENLRATAAKLTALGYRGVLH